MRRPISSFKRTTARQLRSNCTEAEAVLWRHLRRAEIGGTHFRRQVVIGPYVADFACLARHLIVEVDGSQHGSAEGRRKDDVRTGWLESEGYKVLRFWNNDVMRNTRAVLEAIDEFIGFNFDHPTPRASGARPSPSRGG